MPPETADLGKTPIDARRPRNSHEGGNGRTPGCTRNLPIRKKTSKGHWKRGGRTELKCLRVAHAGHPAWKWRGPRRPSPRNGRGRLERVSGQAAPATRAETTPSIRPRELKHQVLDSGSGHRAAQKTSRFSSRRWRLRFRAGAPLRNITIQQTRNLAVGPAGRECSSRGLMGH